MDWLIHCLVQCVVDRKNAKITIEGSLGVAGLRKLSVQEMTILGMLGFPNMHKNEGCGILRG